MRLSSPLLLPTAPLPYELALDGAGHPPAPAVARPPAPPPRDTAPLLDYRALKVTVSAPGASEGGGPKAPLASPAPGCVTTDPRELPIGRPALPAPPSAKAFQRAFADVFARAYLAAHPHDLPDPRALALRLAQSGLESAQGTHLYCFNFGGTKAAQARHFFYASTFEGMPPEKARALIEAHPDLYSMDKQNNRFGRDGAPLPNKDGNVMVRFARAAKGASFAGFGSASAGATAFLSNTERCAKQALHAVDTATPKGSVSVTAAYRDALVASRYFTGDRRAYGRQLAASYDACLQVATDALRRATRNAGKPLPTEEPRRLVLQRDAGELPSS